MTDPRPEFDWMSALDIARAEELIFRVRSVLFTAFALLCAAAFVLRLIPRSSLVVILTCLATGALASWVTMRHARLHRLLPFHAYVNNTIDVTAVTGIAVGSAFTQSGHLAALSPVQLVYFLIIVGSALRFHAASTMYAAVLATVQYAGLAAWAATHTARSTHDYLVADVLHPGSLALRVALLLLAGGVTVLLIRRVKDAVLTSQATQKLHARVVNEISDGLLVCDVDGRIVEANAAATDLLGVPRSVLVGLDAATVLPDPLWSILHERWARILSDGVATADGVQIPRDHGASCFVDVDARCVRVQEDTIVRVVLRDVTAEQSLWEKDSHYKRLTAMRQLATAMSHEFNNILSSIEASAFVLHEAIPDKSPEHEEVDIIRSAAARAATLVREIADLTDTRRPHASPVEVIRVVDRALSSIQPPEQAQVSVAVDVADDVLNLLGDESQLVRAIGKLIGAAYGAMLDGGKLTISARNTRIASRSREMAAGDYVTIEVADNGIGMPADMVERAFDPFQLAESHRWTGFALAGARAIASRHGGGIELTSALGRGSTYTITLPATRRQSAARKDSAEPDKSAPRKARLLLVDDDPASRRSLARVLATRGYEIHLAEDGRAALDLCESEKGAFDLVLLDMVMPGLNGKDVLAALRARFPSIKVLVVTGDADESLTREALELGASGVTHKPFDVLRLFDQVRSLTAAR